MTFFSMDNAFFRTVGKMVDLIWLNLLTVICCIPVFTAGASLTAMYYVELKIVKNQEGSITKNFFKAFKDNFKSATSIWLVVMVALCFYVCDMYILKQGVMDAYGALATVTKICVSAILIFIYMMLCYIFPLLARYNNTLKQTLKNAVLLLFGFFPRSLCMAIIYLFPIALMLLSDYFLFFWLFWGLSFPGFCCGQLMIRIFEKTEDMSARGDQEVE